MRDAIPQLHRWYRRHARDLPWRETADPYAIWVSEVMLQQTQVATVIPYYERWLKRLPTVAALAEASENEVLLLWEGLGYYSRARNLQRAARQVVERHAGVIPRAPADLRRLQGVGPYTAAAVLSIAFGERFAVLDGNVKRVLARLVALEDPVDRPVVSKALQLLADQLLRADPGLHNQAMMELGATVCVPRAPRCPGCPLRRVCSARAGGDPEVYPRKARRARTPHHDLAVVLVQRADEFLLYRRPYGGMLAGLWDLPARRFECGVAGAGAAEVARQLLADTLRSPAKLVRPLSLVRHTYTHLRVTLHPIHFTVSRGRTVAHAADQHEFRWVSSESMAQYPLPRATQKVIAGCLMHRRRG